MSKYLDSDLDKLRAWQLFQNPDDTWKANYEAARHLLSDPVAYTIKSGSRWRLWEKEMQPPGRQELVAHSILFPNGVVFDLYNGWRKNINAR